jgi:hypothetical protein
MVTNYDRISQSTTTGYRTFQLGETDGNITVNNFRTGYDERRLLKCIWISVTIDVSKIKDVYVGYRAVST